MTRRGARFLTRLYPPAWRARYGAEFQTFLESRHVRPLEILNTIALALSERAAGSLTTLLYTCVAIIAPGGALYLTTNGAPLAQTIDAHCAFWLLWAMLEGCSLATVVVGAVAAAPVLFRILRDRRPDVLRRLVWPAVTSLLLALALVVYVAVPESRLRDAGTTLLVVGVYADAVSRFVSYVIGHSRLSRSLGRVKRSVLAMASWIIVASTMAAGYCLQIRRGAFSYWIGALLWLAAMTFRAVQLRLEFRRIE